MQYPFAGSTLGPKVALPSVAGPYMSPRWLHPGSTPFGYVGSSGANNLPVHPRPFTRCSITSSSCDLTIPIQWFFFFPNLNDSMKFHCFLVVVFINSIHHFHHSLNSLSLCLSFARKQNIFIAKWKM